MVEMAVLGVSRSPVCGVRDHGQLLAEALGREGVRCRVRWLSRERTSWGGARSELRAWLGEVGAELRGDPPDAVLVHYSVFSFSHRGVPLLVHPTLAALRGCRAPLVTFLHEFAYPWRRHGWRGAVWALTQRAALIEVMRASAAAVATADFQAQWLVSRRWLPRRPIAIAPVFSNLPPATRVGAGPPGSVPAGRDLRPVSGVLDPPPVALGTPESVDRGDSRPRAVLGLFGYSAEGAAVALTLDAMRSLDDRGVAVELSLLGAPGPRSPAGEQWLAAARRRGLEQRLSFSGVLAPQALADALAACEVLLFAEADGPTSRKTTLAASLASGRPVLAIDGPRRWRELTRAGAVELVQPTPRALTGAIEAALADEPARAELGARGRAFADAVMSPAHAAHLVRALLDEMLLQRGSAQPAVCHLARAVR